jgi:hypothetical protein
VPAERNARPAIVAAFVVLAFLFLAPGYVRPDSVAVVAYLRSAVLDVDFAFFNEWAGTGLVRGGVTMFTEVTPVGALANHWGIGTSILSAPPYLAAYLIGGPPDGFFDLYAAVLAWTNVVFAAWALAIAAGFLSRHAGLAIAATLFGTPLFFQTFLFPLGSTHVAGALAIGLVFGALFHDRDGDALAGLAAGLATGFAIAARLQHVVIVPAVAYVAVRQRRSLRWWLAAIAGGAIPLACQAVAWQAIYGTPLGPLVLGARLEGTTWVPFRNFALFTVLFSSYHGLFSWSPVVALAIVGWIFAARSPDARRRLIAAAALLMFCGEWIANGTLDRFFWCGMSFGARRFIDLAAPIAIGIAWFASSIPTAAATTIVAGCSLWSVGLMVAAETKAISLARYVSGADLLRAVFSAQTWAHLRDVDWHSPVTNGAFAVQSLLALLILGVLAIVAAVLRPRAIAAMVAACAALVVVIVAAVRTPERARQSAQRLHINVAASLQAGPLIDERTLLIDELAWARARGDRERVAGTTNELRAIDARLRSLSR